MKELLENRKELLELKELYETEIKCIKEHIAKIEEICNNVAKQQSELDLAISDIHHDLELSNLSGSEMVRDTKILREILQQRRIVKDIIEMHNIMYPGRKGFSTHINKAFKKISDNRKYKVRVLRGLKIAQVS